MSRVPLYTHTWFLIRIPYLANSRIHSYLHAGPFKGAYNLLGGEYDPLSTEETNKGEYKGTSLMKNCSSPRITTRR